LAGGMILGLRIPCIKILKSSIRHLYFNIYLPKEQNPAAPIFRFLIINQNFKCISISIVQFLPKIEEKLCLLLKVKIYSPNLWFLGLFSHYCYFPAELNPMNGSHPYIPPKKK